MIFKSNFMFADSDIQSLSIHDVVGILQQRQRTVFPPCISLPCPMDIYKLYVLTY